MTDDLMTMTAVGEVFGVTSGAVRQWVKLYGCPVAVRPEGNQRGFKLNLRDVINWRIEHEKQKAGGATEDQDITESKRRKLAAEAALVEHELAVKQGAAVAIEDAVAVIEPAISNCRNKLLGIGAKVAPQVALEEDPAACQSIVDDTVGGILTELENLSIQEQSGGPGSA